MNLSLFLIPDPSGKFTKESYLFKNHKEEYDYIVEWCQLHGIDEIPFKEKVYLVVNQLTQLPVCKNPSCGKTVKFINSTLGYRDYCSTKCISSDPLIKDLKQKKSIQKWGTKTPAESEEIKRKIINTNNKIYGANSPMSNELVQEKSKKTLSKNWRVENPSHSDVIQKKRIDSFKKSDFKKNFRQTSLERYGVNHPWMNPKIHKKTIEFFYSSYRKRILTKIDGTGFEFIDFKMDLSTSLIFKCPKCLSDFQILTWQFYFRVNSGISICTNCYPISQNSSITQIELYNFISENYSGPIIQNAKNVIKPYEIDIYLPDLGIGFEFNGVWWHPDKFRDKDYHRSKIDLAYQSGIKLYSIWEDEWCIKRDICKSFILNKLLKTQTKISARKCQIVEIDYKTSREFLDNNHLQGDCKSSIRLGLYNNNELVSLMTFSKLRLPLQKSQVKRNSEGVFELTRFCNKINTNIQGGASKLISYFIKKYKPNCIETYSDNLISDGKMYQKLGFDYSHTSNPGYWYLVDGIRSHRFNWRKQKLVNLGYDSSKTEVQIMSELGFPKIWNAGNKKWILRPESLKLS
jgi:hypothetical protein